MNRATLLCCLLISLLLPCGAQDPVPPRVNLPLGAGEASLVKDGASSNDYLSSLAYELRVALGGLDLHARFEFARGGTAEGETLKDLLDDMEEVHGMTQVRETVERAVEDTRRRFLRGHGVEAPELALVKAALEQAAKQPHARLVGVRHVSLFAPTANGTRGEWIADLPVKTTTLDLIEARPDGYHLVRTANRTVGLVDAKRVLLELPRLDGGEVFMDKRGELRYLTRDGMRVLPKAGPDKPDPTLSGLRKRAKAAVKDGPYLFEALERRIGTRTPWIAIVDIYELDADLSLDHSDSTSEGGLTGAIQGSKPE